METPWKFHREGRGECKASNTKPQEHRMMVTVQQSLALFRIYLNSTRFLQHCKLDFLYTCGRKSSDWHWDQNHGQSGTLFSKANLYWHIGIFQFQTPFRRSFNTTDGSLISLGTSLKPLSATPSIHIYKSNSTASCNYLSFQRCTNYRNIHS